MELIALFIGSILISNIILVQFLGVCPFLGVSQKSSNALGMGAATTFVVVVSTLLSYGLYALVLKPLKLEYLALLSFILIIASFVQFVEMFLKKYVPSLYKALGIFLPLISTNCIVLGTALNSINPGIVNNFLEVVVYAFAIPIGFTLVLYLFSLIREKIETYNKVPLAFKGTAVALVTAALLALAFSGFAGIV